MSLRISIEEQSQNLTSYANLSSPQRVFQNNRLIQLIASFATVTEFLLVINRIKKLCAHALGDIHTQTHPRFQQYREVIAFEKTMRMPRQLVNSSFSIRVHVDNIELEIPFASPARTGISINSKDNPTLIVVGPKTVLCSENIYLGANFSHALYRDVKSGDIQLIALDQETTCTLTQITQARKEAEQKETIGIFESCFNMLLKSFVCDTFLYTVNKNGLVGQFFIDSIKKTLTLLKWHQLPFSPIVIDKIPKKQGGECLFLCDAPNYLSDSCSYGVAHQVIIDFSNGFDLAQLEDTTYSRICTYCANSFFAFGIAVQEESYSIYALVCEKDKLRLAWDKKFPLEACKDKMPVDLVVDDQFVAVSCTLPNRKWQLKVYPLTCRQIVNTDFYSKQFQGKQPKTMNLHQGLLSYCTVTHLECLYLNAPGGPCCVAKLPYLQNSSPTLYALSPYDVRVLYCDSEQLRLVQYKHPTHTPPGKEESNQAPQKRQLRLSDSFENFSL